MLSNRMVLMNYWFIIDEMFAIWSGVFFDFCAAHGGLSTGVDYSLGAWCPRFDERHKTCFTEGMPTRGDEAS